MKCIILLVGFVALNGKFDKNLGELLDQNIVDAEVEKKTREGIIETKWKKFTDASIEDYRNNSNLEDVKELYRLLSGVNVDGLNEKDAKEWMLRYMALYENTEFKVYDQTQGGSLIDKLDNKGKKLYAKFPSLREDEEIRKFMEDHHMDENIEGEKIKIYKQPTLADKNKNNANLDEIISFGDEFINKKTDVDEPISQEDIKDISNKVFSIVSELAVGIAVLIGLILGIKLMVAGVDEKAEAKKMMWIYLVGCVVAFGAFGIWQIVVEILEKF